MKSILSLFLPVTLFFALFIGCSDGGGNSPGSGGGNDNGTPNVNTSKCGDVNGILKCAVEALKKEEWDEAAAYYDAAYERDNTNTEVIIYSVLVNLAKISVDPKMQSLMKEHFGFTTYPNKLNALLSDSWMKDYKDKYEDCYWDWNNNWSQQCVTGYDNVSLPVIKTPTWVTGSGSMYNKALLSGNVLSVDNFAISLIANVIDKNSNGFNTLLDDVIDGVFGTSYNLALERLKKLENKKEARVKLDPYFIDELNLEDVFDEHDQIGWAEVNAVLSATLLVKASLEWVQSYDLSTDLNWLRYAWKDDSDDIRNQFSKAPVSKLPFKNNFLNSRPGKMAKSKEDYVKAIQGFQSSYTSIVSSAHYPQKVKDALVTINDGLEKLISAINNGSKFYIPEDPTTGTWPTSKRGDVEATINLGKFFTEGYFSLKNIFETTDDGSPVFYLTYNNYDYDSGYSCHYELVEYWDDYWEEWDYDYDLVCEYQPPKPKKEPVKLTKSNYANLISEGGRLALVIKTKTFNDIIDENDDGEPEYLKTGLSQKDAKAVFEKYYP